MEGDAYLLRHCDKNYKTKVQMGLDDLVLYKKEAGGTWKTVPTSLGWPEVTLTVNPQAEPETKDQ